MAMEGTGIHNKAKDIWGNEWKRRKKTNALNREKDEDGVKVIKIFCLFSNPNTLTWEKYVQNVPFILLKLPFKIEILRWVSTKMLIGREEANRD